MGPVVTGTELDGRRLRPGPVPRGTELEGTRLADMLVSVLTGTGLAVNPVPTGAELLETGTGETDEVNCGAREVLLFGTGPYP